MTVVKLNDGIIKFAFCLSIPLNLFQKNWQGGFDESTNAFKVMDWAGMNSWICHLPLAPLVKPPKVICIGNVTPASSLSLHISKMFYYPSISTNWNHPLGLFLLWRPTWDEKLQVKPFLLPSKENAETPEMEGTTAGGKRRNVNWFFCLSGKYNPKLS